MLPIKPISDLKKKSGDIAQLIHRSNGPILITKILERHGDDPMAQYNHLQRTIELYEKLLVAEFQG